MKSSNSVATTTTTSMVDRNAVKDQIMEEANTNAPLSQTSQAPRGDEQQKKEQSRGKWAHNPFVLSLIACSNMHDCDEVEEIFQQCQENKNNTLLCEAALKYREMCHRNGGKLLDECQYRDF